MDVPVTEARAQFADLVNRVAYTGEPVKLTRRGRVMAALVSPEDLELLEKARSAGAGLALPGLPAASAPPAEPARSPALRIAAE